MRPGWGPRPVSPFGSLVLYFGSHRPVGLTRINSRLANALPRSSAGSCCPAPRARHALPPRAPGRPPTTGPHGAGPLPHHTWGGRPQAAVHQALAPGLAGLHLPSKAGAKPARCTWPHVAVHSRTPHGHSAHGQEQARPATPLGPGRPRHRGAHTCRALWGERPRALRDGAPDQGGLGAGRAPGPELRPGSAQTPTHPSPCRAGSRKVDSGTRPALPGADSSRQRSAECLTPAPRPPQQKSEPRRLGQLRPRSWFWSRGWGRTPPRTPPTLLGTRGTPGFQDKLRKLEADLGSQGRSRGGRGEAGARRPGKAKYSATSGRQTRG